MITVNKFVFNDFQENTYVLSDETRGCLLIDPGCFSPEERGTLISFIEANKLQPLKIILTHGHIDHVLGAGFLAERFTIPVFMHSADMPFIGRSVEQAEVFGMILAAAPTVNGFLKDGEVITFGNSELDVLHLPGHSPGGIGLYSSTQDFILTGDVLFRGSIGRTDLPGGNYETQMSSIRNKLLMLDDKTVVYSGHGPETTIGDERFTNPFLQ